jgi:hypothetical protein
MILRQDLLRKTLVPPLVPARGALVACLTGLVTLTSTRIYVLHYSTCTRVPGSVSIHSLRTVVLDYWELLAYWFTLQQRGSSLAAAWRRRWQGRRRWRQGWKQNGGGGGGTMADDYDN